MSTGHSARRLVWAFRAPLNCTKHAHCSQFLRTFQTQNLLLTNHPPTQEHQRPTWHQGSAAPLWRSWSARPPALPSAAIRTASRAGAMAALPGECRARRGWVFNSRLAACCAKCFAASIRETAVGLCAYRPRRLDRVHTCTHQTPGACYTPPPGPQHARLCGGCHRWHWGLRRNARRQGSGPHLFGLLRWPH